jgi:hypothetical protein
MHFKNHTNCSRGYDLKSFSSMSSINTEACGTHALRINACILTDTIEQTNSPLVHIKRSVSYMTHNNFMAYFMFYFSCRNRLGIASWVKRRVSMSDATRCSEMNEVVNNISTSPCLSCCLCADTIVSPP